jgi:O-methyltransferase
MTDYSGGRPRARLITMAWGDRYVEELFNFTLAAALAPGNLPAVVGLLDCDIVILTETARFDTLRQHAVFRALERLCPVELRPVDEFVTRPDAYGMALTYALFRGFEDLGADMVNVHLLFLNSDFVPADGSLRTVANKILNGERLILAPSYCVIAEVMAPELERRRTTEAGIIVVPPRELAELCIRLRHNTIRGKTVNQRLFSMEWIDQFYWLVDPHTLIGRQLPIAVVSMRPERVLSEMVTFWDYGIISQACPTTPRCVIADSDEFLMIELRSVGTARDQLRFGWPSAEEIARKLYRFITADPIELARHTLYLHSADLTPGLARAEAALDSYVSTVLAYLTQPKDYRDHHIWRYHFPTFQKLRGKYLAGKGTPLPFEVEELVEYPPIPAVEVLDAEFQCFARNVAPRDPIPPPPDRLTPRSCRLFRSKLKSYTRWRDLQPTWAALADIDPSRVILVSLKRLPSQVFAELGGSAIEVDGLPPSMEARLWDAELTLTPPDAMVPQQPVDTCLCEIDPEEILYFRDLVGTVLPYVRAGGKIIICISNHDNTPVVPPAGTFERDALALDLTYQVSFVGNKVVAEADDKSVSPSERLRNFVSLLMRTQPAPRPSPQLSEILFESPDICTSITVAIDVPADHHPAPPRMTLAVRPCAQTTAAAASPAAVAKRAVEEISARFVQLDAERSALAATRDRLVAESEVQRHAFAATQDRLIAQREALRERVEYLEDHNKLLTSELTLRTEELQKRENSDYQILMAQQQMLVGMQDADPAFNDIYQRCKEYTMTSVERLYALYKSIEYIVKSGLEGDLVETGVWRAGSCMLMAETLLAMGDSSRRILLFDTFEGHPKPDPEKDVDLWGNRAVEDWERHKAAAETWGYASIDEARANMDRTGYPSERVVFFKGKVEDTIPEIGIIDALALMRLDTDWYESARVTLEHLFPVLVEGGVLIMDDYGHYKGQKQALDEYLSSQQLNLLLHRIDYSCRVAVKRRVK